MALDTCALCILHRGVPYRNLETRVIAVDPSRVAVQYPNPAARLATKIRHVPTGEVRTFETPTVLWDAILEVRTNQLVLAEWELIEGESDSELTERTARNHSPGTTDGDWRIVPVATLPVKDGKKLFRDAWTFDGSSAVVDMVRARRLVIQEFVRKHKELIALAMTERANLEDTTPAEDSEIVAKRSQHAQYRRSLRSLPTQVQADVDAITDAETLFAYRVQWPEARP